MIMRWRQIYIFILSSPANSSHVPPTDGDLAWALQGPCWVAHSCYPLIKLQPCSLLSCWQTKVLKRTPSVIASNLGHNVLFHVNVSQRKGSCCSGLASTFTLSNTVKQTSALIFNFFYYYYLISLFWGRKRPFSCNSGEHFFWHLVHFVEADWSDWKIF